MIFAYSHTPSKTPNNNNAYFKRNSRRSRLVRPLLYAIASRRMRLVRHLGVKYTFKDKSILKLLLRESTIQMMTS